MGFTAYTNKSVPEVLTALSTSLDIGLTQSFIKKIQSQIGTNSLKGKNVTNLQILLRQFKSSFVYLLFTATLISLLLGEYLDACLILLFITINTTLGFYQEYGSEKTLSMLKNYMVPKATVLRNGIKQVINSMDLVPGDIVYLETGAISPADLRVVQENNLIVNESSITGESIDIRKTSEALRQPETELFKAKNIVFSGTQVKEGSAVCVVVAIGKESQLGQITKLTLESVSESGFEKQISKFSKFILFLTLSTLVVVILAHFIIDGTLKDLPSLALFSIALAVGVIPEALPLVTTFSLTHGAKILAKKKVVVKRLSAIEDLGGIEVLCSDKTGTLTQNKLTVADINSIAPEEVLLYGVSASDFLGGQSTPNNAFDLALVSKLGEEKLKSLSKFSKVYEIPFNPDRKRNSVLVSTGVKNEKILIVRGAQESILPFVTTRSLNNLNAVAQDWVLAEGQKGRRVLAIAVKSFYEDTYTVKDEENDLELLGLVSFFDPIKDSTKEAIQKAGQLGVHVKIITGDSAEVSGWVAYEVGISESPTKVLTGQQLDKMNMAQQIKAVHEFDVFARLSPEQKYKIISLLKQTKSVGYLGEGINDAPALKISDVAIVVNDASDVAREASDVVLLEQNLKVIVDGIEEGRKTFVNTTKYIKSTLASNFGNFYAVAFASLVIDYLPMLPIQILLVNLLSDFPMIAVSTDNVSSDEIKTPHSYDVREITFLAMLLGIVSTVFDFIVFGMFHRAGAEVLQTNWFIASIITELLLIFSIRTRRFFLKPAIGPSKLILFLTIVAGITTVLIPFLPFGQQIFGFIKPNSQHVLIIGGIVLAYITCSEFVKLYYYKVSKSLKTYASKAIH